MNVKLTIEYDGTQYCGWQWQANGETVQAAIETALSTYFGAPIRITGSGRTDAGVHACGQVANFSAPQYFDRHKLLRGLNALTGTGITIKQAEVVDDGFDARRDARSRVYRYQIFNRSTPSPFFLTTAWHVHERLDRSAMQAAAQQLLGEHDFTSFRAAGCDAPHANRIIYRADWTNDGELLVFTIEATAFLRHMVRNIVGTLYEVGRGMREPHSLTELLGLHDRTKAGPTAPAHGLFLLEVNYDERRN